MVPSPTSDPALLREHAFYESGNLKYVLPFIRFQTYDESQLDYSDDLRSAQDICGRDVLLLGVLALLALAVSIRLFVSVLRWLERPSPMKEKTRIEEP